MLPISKEKIISIEKVYSQTRSLSKTSRSLGISPNTVKKYASRKMNILTQNIVSGLKSNNDLLIGTYVGLWLGDGTQYYDRGYCVKICSNKENRLLNQFIQNLIYELFGKSSELIEVKHTKQAYIRLYSKFIFNFIHKYIKQDNNKTYTVQLKDNIEVYSHDFIEGCLLGLALSDGYLKEKFVLTTTSPKLAENVIVILTKLEFHPKVYLHKRSKYGWKDLFMIRLAKEESKQLEIMFNVTLKRLDIKFCFKELKNNEPGRI